MGEALLRLAVCMGKEELALDEARRWPRRGLGTRIMVFARERWGFPCFERGLAEASSLAGGQICGFAEGNAGKWLGEPIVEWPCFDRVTY